MKILILIIASFVMNSCGTKKDAATSATTVEKSTAAELNEDKQEQKITVEYSAISRGVYRHYKIENKTIHVQNSRAGKPIIKSCSEADIEQLSKAVSVVNLKQLPELKAPTENRFHDGAAIANLKVIVDGQEYASSAFDDGMPPEEIKALVNTVLSIAKSAESQKE